MFKLVYNGGHNSHHDGHYYRNRARSRNAVTDKPDTHTQTWTQNKSKWNTLIKRKTQHSIKTCAYNECCTRH